MLPHKSFSIFASFVLIFSLLGLGSFPSFAHAENSAVEKAIQNVKDSVGDLVTAKDDNAGNELRLRTDTFRKVLELSITEVKEFKATIVVVDSEKIEGIELWKAGVMKVLDGAQKYFTDKQDWLDSSSTTLDLASIKATATAFKEWRETHYLQTVNQIQDFLLIGEESQAIKTAEKRLQKITDEVKKIIKSKAGNKKAKELIKFLTNAGNLIADAKSINRDAHASFSNNYLLPLISLATSTSTSTPPLTTSTPPTSTSTLKLVVSTSTPTSTLILGDEGSLLPPSLQTPSIKDRVIASLLKIRDAYQVFIDLSNFVRELLK